MMPADVVATLREAGLADWQIARAWAVIEAGGTVSEAEAALYDRLPAPDFDPELFLAGVKGLRETVPAAEIRQPVRACPLREIGQR